MITMMNWLLNWAGADSQPGDRLAALRVLFATEVHAGWWLLGAILLVLASWYTYQLYGDGLTPRRKRILLSLRGVVLLLLLLLLARPVLELGIAGRVRQTVVVLVDDSASMAIADLRVDPVDISRAESLFTAGKNSAGPTTMPSRSALALAALAGQRVKLLEALQREYRVVLYTFGAQNQEISLPDSVTKDLAWQAQIKADLPATAIGEALRDALVRQRGQSLAGVVLITDGGNNAGLPMDQAATLAQADHIPLFIYGTGITNPKDLAVVGLLMRDSVFVRDDVPVVARVQGRGLKGEKSRLLLRQGKEVVASEDVTWTGDDEVLVPLKYIPKQPGEYEITAEFETRSDEVMTTNNAYTQKLKVVDDRIRVLQVEQTPRWEYKHIQNMLMRDRRVEYHSFLAEVDPGLTQGEKTPYLAKYPKELKDLVGQYDVIIWGDVDPKKLPDTALPDLQKFVSIHGGSLLVIPGRMYTPNAYAKTALASLLPVEFQVSRGEDLRPAVFNQPIKLELTPLGRTHNMLNLSDKPEDNLRLWNDLPPVYWAAPVVRAKPGAEVLVVDGNPARVTRFGKQPVLVLQQYGIGSVLWVGTDNTWRWRRNEGEKIHIQFWSQMIERLAVSSILGQAKMTQLSTDQPRYEPGVQMQVYARFFDSQMRPFTQEQVTAQITPLNSKDAPRELILRALPGQEGMYRASLSAPAVGRHKITVAHDPKTFYTFEVETAQRELLQAAMNETGLQHLVDTTGGHFYREEQLDQLPRDVLRTVVPVLTKISVEFWSSPLLFVLLVALVSVEWILRKRWYLK